MSARINVSVFDRMLRELTSPNPPAWVIKARADRAELERVGARVRVEPHIDNTGMPCRNVGPAALVEDCRTHDCCGECNKLGGEGE